MVKTTINLDSEVYKELVNEAVEKYGTTKTLSKIINEKLRASGGARKPKYDIVKKTKGIWKLKETGSEYTRRIREDWESVLRGISTDEVLFDTSVIIDHLRGVNAASHLISRVQNGELMGFISVITEPELFAGKDMEDEEKEKSITDLLALFTKIPVDSHIAKIAGSFKRKHNVLLPDCIIAATAFIQGYKLLTKNTKDFERIKEIRTEAPY
jgi:tRNA(fMet)-specific endonuclease VapC